MTFFIKTYGQGYPLVFFHGWGFDSTIWSDLIPLLQPHYTVHLVDLPGFGQSDLMDWDDFRTSLLLQLPSQFALVGWSLGGLYAMRLAIEAPDRVSQLFVVASSPHFIEQPNPLSTDGVYLESAWPGINPSVFDAFLARLQTDWQKSVADFVALQAGSNLAFVHQGKADNLCLTGLQQGLETLVSWDFRGDIERYKNPACFIFGRLDAIVPYKTLLAMQQMYPQFEYRLFKKAAHMPFISHQEAFVSVLREFL